MSSVAAYACSSLSLCNSSGTLENIDSIVAASAELVAVQLNFNAVNAEQCTRISLQGVATYGRLRIFPAIVMVVCCFFMCCINR